MSTTKAVVTNSVIIGNSGSGIVARDTISPFFRIVGKARVSNSTIANNGRSGVLAGVSITVRNSAIRDNAETGVWTFRDFHSDNNLNPVGGAKISGSTISGNQMGIFANKVLVADSMVTKNAIRGIEANVLTVRGLSDLRGNATSAGCGTADVCLDVATSIKPFGVSPANCDTSRQLKLLPGFGLAPDSWGVCSLD